MFSWPWFWGDRERVNCSASARAGGVISNLPARRAIAGEPMPRGADAGKNDPAAVEFFEKSVRPILATRCQGCHGPSKQKGNLRRIVVGEKVGTMVKG